MTANPTLQNLARLPRDVQPAIQKYAGSVFPALGENLRSLAVFGSATGPDYVPARSDVNVLVGVRVLGAESLRGARPPVRRLPRRPLIRPLVLTRDYIRESTDTFPIEFLEMKERQILLYGDDLLDGVEVRSEDVRRQCERELKAHLIRLRQAYIEAGRSEKELEHLLHAALTSLLPILRNLLRLKDPGAPRERAAVIAALGPAFAINPDPMLAVQRDREGGGKISGRNVESVFDSFQRELEELTRAVDRM